MPRRKTTYTKRKSSYKRRPSTVSSRSPVRRKNRLLLPYPLIGFMLLAIGLLLIGITFKSSADSVDLKVKAKISAPLPTQPAIITSPINNQTFKYKPITVSGTCPTDNYPGNYVVLLRNGVNSGAVPCSSDGTFRIESDLFAGNNELIAQIYNVTDDAGPPSDAVTVQYDPVTATVPLDSQSLTIPPFLLKTDFKYKSYLTGQSVNWDLEISGGEPAYAIKVDWGDGQTSLISQKSQGKFTIEHKYNQPGQPPSYNYTVKVSAVDGGSRTAYIQFFIRVNPFNAPLQAGPTNTTSSTSSSSSLLGLNLLAVAWPAYGILVLMTISFWLGEQEEFFLLRKKGAIKKRYG
jgi:hypothetical protein